MNTIKSNHQSRTRMARWTSAVLLPAALGTLLLAAGRLQAQPTIPGPTPTPPPGHVVAVYNSSGVYTDIPVPGGYFNDWYNPGYNPGNGPAGLYDVSGGDNIDVLYYPAPIIIWGIDFSANAVNVSGCTNLHVDVWSPTATTYDIRLVNTVGGSQQADATGTIVTGGWNSLNIPLSVFTKANPAMSLAGIGQIGILGDNTANSTYYIDNIYFQAGTNLVSTTPPPPPAPTNNAATPVWTDTAVLALYNSSGTYPNATYIDWPAPWSGSPQTPFTITNVTPNSIVENLPGLSYVGEDYYSPYQIDTTPYNTFHIDLWTAQGNQFYIQLVSLSPTEAAQVGVFNFATNQWVGIDIPLSQFAAANPATDLSNLQQLLWVDNVGPGLQSASFYFDNVYFYNRPVAEPLSVSRSGKTINLSYPTQSGFNYTVLYKTSLTDAAWQTLSTSVGDGTTQSATDSIGTKTRFYRLSIN
jgi:hypothetical protein